MGLRSVRPAGYAIAASATVVIGVALVLAQSVSAAGSATAVGVDFDATGNARDVVGTIDPTTSVNVGAEIPVDLVVTGAVNVTGFNIQIDYDPAVLELKELAREFDGSVDSAVAGFLSKDGATPLVGHKVDDG